MSMISKQVEGLRNYAKVCEASNMIFLAAEMREAANTIETLSAKVRVSNLNSEWIPVSPDSMPSYNEDVIVTVRDDSGDSINYYTKTAWWLSDDTWISDNDLVFGEVTAWKSLPEPYKENK